MDDLRMVDMKATMSVDEEEEEEEEEEEGGGEE